MARSIRDIALLILRLGLAMVFLYHGSQKVLGWFGGSGIGSFASYLTRIRVPYPQFAAPLAAGSELLGELSLFFGFTTRYLLGPLALTMLVACLVNSHSGFDNAHGGAEFPLLCLCGIIALLLLGPGGWSLSALVSNEKEVQ